MSAILTRVEIGQVGALPGTVLMSTKDNLETITSPGYLSITEGGVTLLPTDIIYAVYGDPMVNKQQFSPSFMGTVVTLVTVGGGGSINTGLNLGSGNGVYAAVSGDALTFKSLVAGANISLTPSSTEITIAATGSGGGTITDGANIGDGEGNVFSAAVGSDLQFKTIKAGTNVVVTEDSDTVTIAATNNTTGLETLANLPGGEGIYATTVGSTAQLKSIAGGAGIGISATGNTIVITNEGTGGDGFDYVRTYWVAQNGNDANNGLSIATPKLTIQGVLTAIAADAPTANTAINITDSGTYAGPFTFPNNCSILINAPGTVLSCATDNMFIMNGGVLEVVCGLISAASKRLFNCANADITMHVDGSIFGLITNDNTNATAMRITCTHQIAGNITVSSNGTNIINFDTLSGDFTDTSPASSTPRNGLIGRDMTGNISSTNSAVYGNIPVVTGSISGINQGFFNGQSYGITTLNGVTDMIGSGVDLHFQAFTRQIRKIVVLTDDYTLTGADSGTTFVFDAGGDRDITFPEWASDPDFPEGFYVQILQFQAGKMRVVAETNVVRESVGGDGWTGGRGSWSQIALMREDTDPDHTRTISFGGQISGAAFATGNIYVSQLTGSDVTGDGSMLSPYATIQFAVTAAGTPTNPATIFILDGETYTESVTVAHPNINIVGFEALLVQSGGVDALTFTSNSAQHFVNLGGIIGSGGSKALVNTGTSTIVSVGGSLNGDVQTTNGQIQILSPQLSGNFASIGSGAIRYNTTLRAGTDGTNVIGISPSGVTGAFKIGAYTLPATDGTAGQVLTTDGAGNVSWA